MPERVEQWWSRRQWSKGTTVPYEIGRFRADWERYPVLVRQYHPDLNHGITLTQVPPAADVYLVWQCDSGHRFVATPDEQRQRPGTSRRRSTWCPDCAALAVRRRAPTPTAAWKSAAPESAASPPELAPYACGHPRDPDRIEAAPGGAGPADDRCSLCLRLDSAPVTRDELLSIVAPRMRGQLADETRVGRRYTWLCPKGHGSYEATIERMLGGSRCRTCLHARAAADRVEVGEAFSSPWAPATASAAEADLRQRLSTRLAVDLAQNAVRVPRPFFSHVEVWPDIVIAELRVAIEYDTTGRDGLEHVGRREQTDRRKDRLLRSAGWEVIRVRCGKLQPIGPHDIQASGVSATLIERVLDELREVRGDLIVNSYLA
ncbi:zinc-ribbon domain-containing protein [Lacisediminihabitans sp.]|uniref:zinc-ribbon domain-containing protein n=1 Tax=Lacisediminihabitans sp. TaxID=2787631 RepID=UPI00374D5378